MNGRLKTLGLGILLIILVGIGGLVYRNAIERPNQGSDIMQTTP